VTRRQDLGRQRGVFVPPHDVEVHLANGWALADDLADASASDGVVLLTPPAERREAQTP
jgi:hypothetical protein